MLSCKTSKLVQKDVSIDKFLSNEWISFDIKRLLYDGGTLRFEPVSSKVIIHNASDSTREQQWFYQSSGFKYRTL